MALRLIILHSNDIHGRAEGIARIASLVERTRIENQGVPVLYFDAGDVEEPSSRLSNVTKGTAMHRLLHVAGCEAAAAGNGAWLRYGPQVLRDHAAAARYPILAANLRMADGSLIPGAQPTVLLEIGATRLGIIGMTAEMPAFSGSFDLRVLPPIPLVRDAAASLRQDGADAVIVLSHMGLPADRELASSLQEDVIAIIGGHTHNLLPEGEWIGHVLIAQAGQYAEHLGRLDLTQEKDGWVVTRASTMLVDQTVPPSPAVLDEVQAIEAESAAFLAEVVGELARPLDFATDRECGVADWMADVLRERMGAEVGIVAAGQAFSGPLPAGPLRRGTLWDVCSSTANPALVTLAGARLAALVAKGLDPAFAATTAPQLRGSPADYFSEMKDDTAGRPPEELPAGTIGLGGSPRGLLHVSGATVRQGRVLIAGEPVDPDRLYRVAGTDWEFEPYGGYVDPAWGLVARYDLPTILREALEEHLATHRPVDVRLGRLEA